MHRHARQSSALVALKAGSAGACPELVEGLGGLAATGRFDWSSSRAIKTFAPLFVRRLKMVSMLVS